MNIETEFFTIINKNRYLRNFIRDKKLILSIIAIVLAWSLIYLVLFYKPSYESKASVWIKDLATEEFVTTLDSQSQLKPLTAAGNPLLTQTEILKSVQLKQAIVEYKLSQGEKVGVNSVNIGVKNKPSTDILNIEIKDVSPEKAKDALEAVLREYDNINLSINRKTRTARREYIDSKLTEIDQKLHEVRTQIKNYKLKTSAIDIDQEAIMLVQQQVAITSKLEDTIASRRNAESSIRELQNQLSLNTKEAINAVALGTGNQNLVKLREELNDSVQEYQFDSAKLADTNPKMIAQRNKIDAIKKQIKQQIELSLGRYGNNQKVNIFDPVREDLVRQLASNQANLMGLRAQESAIGNSIKKNYLEQAQMPEKKFTLDNLEQEERALSDAYDQLKEKQIEAKIKEAEAVSNVIVIDPPSLPSSASFPTGFQTLILAIILGLGAGLTFSVLKTFIEDVCDDVESIEEITGTSVVGIIPWVEHLDSETQIQSINGLAYDNIVSNLMIKCYKNNKKTLAFTSSSLKKTQSKTIYQIASRLKKSGHSVVIVDSDFRIPTLIKNVDVENKTVNLSELIISIEKKFHQMLQDENNNKRHQELIMNKEVRDALIKDEIGINHIGNRDIILEPYEYFGTKAFEYIIAVLKEKFDWVLIDTGVAHLSPEFLIVSKLSDGVVLLTSKTITHRTLKTIIKSLKNASIPLLGTIVRESGSEMKIEYEKYLRFQKDRLTDEEIRG